MAKFAEIAAKAEANRKHLPPYVLDDLDPPVVIEHWEDLERSSAISAMLDQDGRYELKNSRQLFEAFCGDAFERMWELCRRKHASVMHLLVDDMIRHFAAELEVKPAAEGPLVKDEAAGSLPETVSPGDELVAVQ